MKVQIDYKGATITTLEGDGSVSLHTDNKVMEDDITVTVEGASEGGSGSTGSREVFSFNLEYIVPELGSPMPRKCLDTMTWREWYALMGGHFASDIVDDTFTEYGRTVLKPDKVTPVGLDEVIEPITYYI